MAKFSTSNVYSDGELLALFREAYAQIAATGVSYSIAGRQWSSADLPQIRDEITWLEGRIDGDSAPAQNLARLVRR
jgi:hypothetical protein